MTMLSVFLKSLRSGSGVLNSTLRSRLYSISNTDPPGRIQSTMENRGIIPAHQIALQHLDRVAIKDSHGSHTYLDVLLKAIKLSNMIKSSIGPEKNQERIGFLCPNDSTYVISQWACWAAGHIGIKTYIKT